MHHPKCCEDDILLFVIASKNTFEYISIQTMEIFCPIVFVLPLYKLFITVCFSCARYSEFSFITRILSLLTKKTINFLDHLQEHWEYFKAVYPLRNNG